nr:DNA ligase [Streptomyces sp. SID2888]
MQSRTGRDVTALWMDLAVAAMRLLPGVVLDGEAVVYVAGADGTAHISFAAAQSRALSSPRRARELAARHPATYVAFDALAHPAAGVPDLRPRPYSERRQVLLDVLAGVGPPIEPVWSTTDRAEALLWYESLEGTGVEGDRGEAAEIGVRGDQDLGEGEARGHGRRRRGRLHRHGPASEDARRAAARRAGGALATADHGARLRRRPAPAPPGRAGVREGRRLLHTRRR